MTNLNSKLIPFPSEETKDYQSSTMSDKSPREGLSKVNSVDQAIPQDEAPEVDLTGSPTELVSNSFGEVTLYEDYFKAPQDDTTVSSGSQDESPGVVKFVGNKFGEFTLDEDYFDTTPLNNITGRPLIAKDDISEDGVWIDEDNLQARPDSDVGSPFLDIIEESSEESFVCFEGNNQPEVPGIPQNPGDQISIVEPAPTGLGISPGQGELQRNNSPPAPGPMSNLSDNGVNSYMNWIAALADVDLEALYPDIDWNNIPDVDWDAWPEDLNATLGDDPHDWDRRYQALDKALQPLAAHDLRWTPYVGLEPNAVLRDPAVLTEGLQRGRTSFKSKHHRRSERISSVLQKARDAGHPYLRTPSKNESAEPSTSYEPNTSARTKGAYLPSSGKPKSPDKPKSGDEHKSSDKPIVSARPSTLTVPQNPGITGIPVGIPRPGKVWWHIQNLESMNRRSQATSMDEPKHADSRASGASSTPKMTNEPLRFSPAETLRERIRQLQNKAMPTEKDGEDEDANVSQR